MEPAHSAYVEALSPVEAQILSFLRFFEQLQEEIHFNRVAEAQQRLQEATANLFPQLPATLSALTPPEPWKDFHSKLSEAVSHFAESSRLFLSGRGRQFAEAFLHGRDSLCRGLYLLYDLRAQLPGLQGYWVSPEALSSAPALETTTADVAVPVGFSHKPRTNTHTEYSLYVPENYAPGRPWPLIVCLHGGYGRGDEYIWTWLRPAKSRGYLLLSPKSAGPTWSVLQPPTDIRSIQAMIDEVCSTYTVDRQRLFLSGLSDGGTFTYLLGFSCPELFAGAAVIAGELHPMIDGLLRQKKGKDLPLFIVHGAHDWIFPITSVRQSCGLLTHLGYNITYKELPDWGHALTYSINEQLVTPWFAGQRKT